MFSLKNLFFVPLFILPFGVLMWLHVLTIDHIPLYIGSALMAPAGMWIERKAGVRYRTNWGSIRERGKWRFILTEYLAGRGIGYSAVVLFILLSKVSINLIILCSILPIFAVTVLVGNEVWKTREQRYVIDTLRSAAESVRIQQN